MALAQKQVQDLDTSVSHYEIITEQLKNARIDRLEDVLIEKINSTNNRINSLDERLTEKINSTNNRINALDERLTEKINSTKNELLAEIKSTNIEIKNNNERIHTLDEKLTEKIKFTNSKMNLFFSLILAFITIGFGGVFALLGTILSKLVSL